MQIGKLEVRCDDIRRFSVSGVLHRGEIVDVVFTRYNDDTARMLTRGALDADHHGNEAVDLCARQANTVLLGIFRNITEGGL